MEKKKVLIVDDEPDLVEAIQFNLELEGLECFVAHDGLEAIEKVQSELPDLILLDVMMPEKNGYQVSRLLKFDDKFKHIPILMLTARSQETDRKIGKETGVNEYITKPFEMDDLIRHVKAQLNIF